MKLKIALNIFIFIITVCIADAKQSLILQSSDIEQLANQTNAVSVRLLFPGAKDKRLKNVFEVQYASPSDLNLIYKQINLSHLVEFVDMPVEVDRYSVIPAVESGRKDFVDYQWAIKNTGQQIYHRYDYDLPVHYTGSPGFDVNWSYIKKYIDPKIEDSVVAVIDSGISSLHVESLDLKGKLYKNETECGLSAGADKNYPYSGDCYGYNFAALVDADKTNVEDYDGHGTHIAGILAANDNEFGVTGLSQKIKILPVKIFLAPEEYTKFDSSDENLHISNLSTSVAEGIYYSIYRGVDVINLSLGWPPLLELEIIKRLLTIAKEKNIAVVAAAGNDRSFSQVKPCAHDSVICVGSASADARVSSFSNYGQHVDFFAPGDYILSSFPENKSLVFFSGNYEYLSGSSQASPYIAGLVAIAKKTYPEMNLLEIKQLLAKSSAAAYPKGLNFLPDVSKWNELVRNKHFEPYPNFKSEDFISFDSKGKGELSFSFETSNPGDLERLRLKLEVITENYQTDQINCKNSEKEKKIQCIAGMLVDLDLAESALEVDVIWSFSDEKHKAKLFLHTGLKAEATGSYIYKGKTKNLEFKTPVPILKQDWTDSFYVVEEQSITLVSAIESSKLFSYDVNSNESVLSLYTGDLNYDFENDYLLITAIYQSDKKQIQVGQNYHYLSAKGKSLFPKQTVFKLSNPRVGINVLNLDSLQWNRLETSFGSMAVPVLWAGRAATKDNSLPKVYSAQTNSSQAVYTYSLADCETGFCLEPVLIDNNLFYWELRKKLKHLNHKVLISSLLVQDKKSYYSGKFRMLLAYGEGKLGDQNILEWTSAKEFSSIQIESSITSLIGQSLNPIFDLDAEGEIFGYNYFFPSQYKLRFASIDMKNKKVGSSYFAKDPESPSIGVLLSFLDSGKIRHISFNNKEVFLRDHATQKVLHKKSILKNTIVPHTSLSQSYIPFLIKEAGNRYGAYLFVEESNIEANQVHFLKVNGTRLVSKLRYKFKIPKDCKAENPALSENREQVYLVMSCSEDSDRGEEQNSYTLRTIAL